MTIHECYIFVSFVNAKLSIIWLKDRALLFCRSATTSGLAELYLFEHLHLLLHELFIAQEVIKVLFLLEGLDLKHVHKVLINDEFVEAGCLLWWASLLLVEKEGRDALGVKTEVHDFSPSHEVFHLGVIIELPGSRVLLIYED